MYRVVIKSGCGKNWDVHVETETESRNHAEFVFDVCKRVAIGGEHTKKYESQILADVPNCFAYHSTEKGCDTWEGITRIITFEEVA